MYVAVYDPDGLRVAEAWPEQPFAAGAPAVFPASATFEPMPGDEPPVDLATFEAAGREFLAARLITPLDMAGYIAVSLPLEITVSLSPAAAGAATRGAPARTSGQPGGALQVAPPPVASDRRTSAVRTVRWAARMLTYWLRTSARLDTMTEELALLGDIGELLGDHDDLQAVLDRITRETARVMRCKYASLRLYEPETGAMRIASAFNLSQRYSDHPVVMRHESPIDDLALRGELVYIDDAASDGRIQFKEEVATLGIHSGLTAGIFHRGRPLGVLRVYSDRVRRFSAPHRHLLRAVAAQAGIAIDNARRVQERLRAAGLERQIALAGEVQQRMMRGDRPRHENLEIAMLFEPSWHLGGDFCDTFALPDGRTAALVGDVVGHGAAAALLMANARAALRAHAQTTSDLGELLRRLNRQFCRDTRPAEFVTLLIVAVDPSARRLGYASAGHDPLMLRRGDELLQPDGGELVLGLDPDVDYGERQLDLRAGDFVLLYTDGLVEAHNFSDELFGRRRLGKLVQRYGTLPPEQALQNMHWDVRRFCGLAEQSDDQTMVALRVRS